MMSRFRLPSTSSVTTLLAVAALSAPSLALAASTTVTLTPVADSYVSPDGPDSNFGNHGTFIVNRGYAEAYLRFDLSSLPANAVITAASLSALAYDGYAYGGDGNVYTSFVANDSWQEMGITWNNRPAPAATPVGEWFLWYDFTPEDKRGINSNAALIPVVQGELAGDKQVSFRLHSPGYKTRYRSREVTNAAQRPALTLTYELGPVTTVLEPEADAYVNHDYWGESDWNYGSAQELVINYGFDRKIFLRFNLASIPAGAVIQSVKLSATAFWGVSPGGDGNVYTYLVPDNNWGEYSITYNNQPAATGSPLGWWWLWYPTNNPYFDQVGVTEDTNFIPVLQAASDASDRRVSFRLSSPYYLTSYYSRESPDASKHPKLEVTYLP
ncbi:DNRLRE domain-containing protein [Corallococcus exiguus]|uniref:CBM96 family carbohydrate-binding protein n=1 Tax=Corallococcus TaxID=83461 RepID=UPI001315A35A|nr:MULTISPECIES: DNRLRE domain-containing protein [Corallococcus]NNC14913.1 DNRLRE domain-containing protein [Corallococcus exiguus]NRD64602.1 DNRLRE domain-containing protein [Corallococcus exiguus]